MAIKGIDVATFQGYPDWNKVKAGGVEFAIIKATQGRSIVNNNYLFTDSKFNYNIENAHKSGVAVGVYHYLTAKTVNEAVIEADYFLKVISPYKSKITLWAVVDVEEDRYLSKDKALLTSMVNTFCERVKSAGFKPMIYTNPNYLKNRLNDVTKWELWLALWRDKKRAPVGYQNLRIWQWGASKVNGIVGDVDSNIGYFEIGEINYADIVCRKCGFEPQTRRYLDEYAYSGDLWRKLYEQIK